MGAVLGVLVPALAGGADADALAAPLLLAAALGAGSAAVALLVVPLPVPRASGAGAFRAGVRARPQRFVRDTARLAAADPALRLLLTVTLPATTTPPPATTPDPDTVTITRAEYDSDKRQLHVEATSSRNGATLRVHVTSSNDLIGTLSGGAGQFSVGANPPSITLRSRLGDADSDGEVAGAAQPAERSAFAGHPAGEVTGCRPRSLTILFEREPRQHVKPHVDPAPGTPQAGDLV